MEYLIKRAPVRPSLRGRWGERAWRGAQVGVVGEFLPRSSNHRPRTEFKVTYREREGLFVFFRVFDRYVVSTRQDYQAMVCNDSCVEFFVEPKPGRGYLNFEINCGGCMLLYHIKDPTCTANGFADYSPLPAEANQLVKRYHSLPAVVYPEMRGPVEWRLEYFIPLAVLERCAGRLGRLSGQTWRANFYKCAGQSSHPHWASWASVHGKHNFHLPEYFAPIRFE